MRIRNRIFSTPLRVALATVALAGFAPIAGQAAPSHDNPSEITTKPTAPIAISYHFGNVPQIGQPVEVIISVTSNIEMSQVEVRFIADDPLALIDPLDGVGLASVAAGEDAELSITVLPLLDQTHYLGVNVTAVIDGVVQSRSIAVPIRMPGTALRKAAVEPAGKPVERVRSFEAIETVR
jgi:hypothetical protein